MAAEPGQPPTADLDRAGPAELAGLPSVFWLGGGCGAGKTTVATVVARRLDLRFYPVDGRTYEHFERSAAGTHPRIRQAGEMSREQRWRQTPDELADAFVASSAERMGMIGADLRALGAGPTVLVEGPQLFPDLVAGLLGSARHGLWLLPSAETGRRGVETKMAGLPQEAVRRRWQRDALLTEINRRQAAAHGLPVTEVELSRPLADVIAEVTGRLERLTGLRQAVSGAQRQRIRQAENAVIVRQLLSWWRDLGREQMPAAPEYGFCCECRSLGCEQSVTVTVTEYQRLAAAGPVTAEPAGAPVS